MGKRVTIEFISAMKRFFIIIVAAASLTTASAQDETIEKEKVSATLGLDLVNQYIWRGQNLGNVSLQPTLAVGYKGLGLTAWGSVGIADAHDTKELDFTLNYGYKGFNIGITDYWFSVGHYFQYKNKKTTHIFEGFVGYDFGFLSATWYTYFAGDDSLNKDGKRAYSTYFELAAPFRLGGLDWKASVGMVPWSTTLYGTSHFAVTNVSLRATKNFEIKKKYQLPVFVGVTTNPNSQKFYLLCGVSFFFKQ